jgi:dTDP-4-dehydrorhamnose 3,5-epimerase
VLRLEPGAVVEGTREPFVIRQLSSAYADPFRLNAFHIHPRIAQRELWSVLHGSLTVWLVDCRRDSADAGRRQSVHLSGEEPALLHIPAGVAHGYKAGPEGALFVYAMDQQFDRKDPNEGRLPWDYFGAELWEVDRG